MKHGVWTPLPHTIKHEPGMAAVVADAVRQEPVDGPDKGLAFALEALREAERLGFATTLVAERFMGPDLEAWMLAAALATQTSTIELIVAVHPGMFTPQVVAKMIASLDRISGGRAAANIVNGWFEAEFMNYGNGAWLPSSEARYERMREFVSVLRGMTENRRFSFAGAFYNVDDVELPVRPVKPELPIYAASSGEAGKELIAAQGHCWMLLPVTQGDAIDFEGTLAKLTGDIAEMRERAARHGRTLRFGLTSHVIACATAAEAEQQLQALWAYGKQAFINQVVARSVASGLVGDYDTVAARLSAYRHIGIDTTMFHFSPMIEGMRAFMHEVVPRMDPPRDA